MGNYTITRCGICSETWEAVSAPASTLFGAPNVKCKSCGIINKTRFTLYRDMSVGLKMFFLFGQFVFKFFLGVLGLLLIYPGIRILLDVFLTFKIIKSIQNTYDKNGGFLWSNEQYLDGLVTKFCLGHIPWKELTLLEKIIPIFLVLLIATFLWSLNF